MQSSATPAGYRSSDECGYCKDDANSRASFYFLSKRLTVEVYQLLVDRGWRRSGTLFYKPDVLRHCCPHYTIRLPVASFKPAKDQRKAVNHWNDHVLGESYIKEASRLYPLSKQEKARLKNTFDLVREVHRAELQNIKQPPEPAHRFEVTLEPAVFTAEKYDLFKNYQQTVHKEPPSQISQSGFRRFLCDSPLQQTSRTINGKEQLLGSFHQCYRLNGRLIAMGVLDLLPHCVSGVYMLYHSDFAEWQFGKLSALREAALALEGGYEYYYMGYYIHTCTKMKYKGDYKPQHVLDPESYEWHPLDGELRSLLDKKKYVSMARERRRRADGVDTAEQDDYSDYPLVSPTEAANAWMNGMSLFHLKMPGVMTAEEIEEKIDLATMPFRAGSRLVELQDLVSWDSSDLRDPHSIQGMVGEMVACMGPEVAWQIVVQLR
ncbi:hypothetical protein COCC4DRAFT_184710 [Bipolaris maydis ATCC 48331]|uniref:arginyltransferase n=2 Tax=Cochliobolus heterostrophus TaxID=5016 RepID=M2TFS5_COCH5|nr:uncharacterized protein COCC4DRAFT_184710 [Bipolaris maydis ATCC 48331]EMD96300.1 hypothetical protein COCHEDRAFT_1128004 [Bipolaris maydis C5]KAJ5030955.1 arginine-tRNA-protein transferase [Bipolaris maydis]ENI11160.1 hypothetical protein COCC4DRAFT_184710 [Bipolaris maydis ATCC 48331]KAJ5065977.1 arginine-tRNA-protein transferase 1 [Bipolaris maydis]KAJ6201177.1 arginine-tRNA-protein transferase 1 [Bipolaris maydis]